MGCGPLLRARSDCTTVTANLHRSIPAFRTPSAATRRLPRFAEKGGPACRRFVVACWAYCLMPNPRPSDPRARRRRWARAGALPEAPSLRRPRQRAGAPNHLFQGRFGAVAMDEDCLMAAAGAVALFPYSGIDVERSLRIAAQSNDRQQS